MKAIPAEAATGGAPPPPWTAATGGLRVRVRLTPRGGRDAVDGVQRLSDGTTVLAVRVRAVPEKGAANAALLSLVADAAGVPSSQAALVAGATGRVKTVAISGDAAALAARLAAVAAGAKK